MFAIVDAMLVVLFAVTVMVDALSLFAIVLVIIVFAILIIVVLAAIDIVAAAVVVLVLRVFIFVIEIVNTIVWERAVLVVADAVVVSDAIAASVCLYSTNINNGNHVHTLICNYRCKGKRSRSSSPSRSRIRSLGSRRLQDFIHRVIRIGYLNFGRIICRFACSKCFW